MTVDLQHLREMCPGLLGDEAADYIEELEADRRDLHKAYDLLFAAHGKLQALADAQSAELLALAGKVAELEGGVAAKQAKIDALMWEHDPDSMTDEQVARWEAAQTKGAKT